MNWKTRFRAFGYCSVARNDNAALDAQLEAEMSQFAKVNKMEYAKGTLMHSVFPTSRKTEWTDEKLQQPRKRR